MAAITFRLSARFSDSKPWSYTSSDMGLFSRDVD
ncbi:hypothetical protein COLO4_02305 [Corchorus olitorius]|uniref:Uncharacterized protein n=1 Tax=Corchorus olitorius TaxID=93759 RepID=A0A1R3L1A2_9ROSI|nr:hypothetical protein COLO4_02305 [Corchorus olitorius]